MLNLGPNSLEFDSLPKGFASHKRLRQEENSADILFSTARLSATDSREGKPEGATRRDARYRSIGRGLAERVVGGPALVQCHQVEYIM